jgi:hypothetical protein
MPVQPRPMDSPPPLALDMDLLRQILIWAEYGGGRDRRPQADDVALCYHIKIMREAGLIEGTGEVYPEPGTGRLKAGVAIVRMMTLKGQEFLKSIREDTIWNKVKEEAKQHGIPLLVDTAKAMAMALVAKLTHPSA